MTLPARLKAIFDLVPEGSVAADVGCDHGKLAVSLAKSGKCPFVYTTDISEKCLEKAVELAKKCGVYEKMRFLRADGIKDLQVLRADGIKNLQEFDDVNTIIIAGMGGHNIADILSAASKEYACYILMSHKNTDVAKAALPQKLQVLDIQIKEKGRTYDIIYATHGGQ